MRDSLFARVIALGVLAVLIAARAWDPPLLESARLRVFDAYQMIAPRAENNAPVTVIDIDEASLGALGQWPWPRSVMAEIVRNLREENAAAIGFDIVFAEADRLSPAEIARTAPDLSPAARRALDALPDHDARLADEVRQSRVVLGQTGINIETEPAPGAGAVTDRSLPQAGLAYIGGDPRPMLVAFPGLLPNIPPIDEAAGARGIFTIKPDIDGIVRRIPLVVRVNETIQPTLALEMLKVATGETSLAVRSDTAGVREVVIGSYALPTDRHGRLWVHYRARDPARRISAQAVYHGTFPVERVSGHLVLIGASAAGLLDLKPTPLDPAMPGVDVHAQVLESVLSETLLVRPDYAIGAEIAIAALIALLMIAFLPVLGAMPVLFAGLLAAGALLGTSWYLFAEQRLLIDVVYPLIACMIVFSTLAFMNYRREESQKRRIRSAFRQYLAPDMVERLAREPKRLVLGGETREMTILFSDIRGFTTISEAYKDDPQGLTKLINQLLTPLTEAIVEKGGTIDKYMGDAIMAFWNAPLAAPDHAKSACAAALEMIERLEALNTARGEAPDMQVGIGINTGDVVVGNMGSTLRFDYTVLGDSVNLASRLEGQSKAYGVKTVLGEATARAAEDTFAIVEIDLITVKGKTEPARIFTLLGDDATREADWFIRFSALNTDMLAAYRALALDELERILEAMAALEMPLDLSGYVALYRERLAAFRLDPPPADWGGVFVATSK